MSGWIKLHRKIKSHWVFSNANYLKAWICILLEVNHTEKKVLIGGTLFTCGVGESLNSLDTWAGLFGNGWNKSSTRRFFILLEKDGMVVTNSETKTTRLSVCKYEDFQHRANADEPHVKRKRNAGETQVTPNKKLKKIQEVKEVKNIYGTFKNVLLTEKQYGELKKKFNGTCDDKIETLSLGIESKGYKYKNHYATILAWDRKEKKDNNGGRNGNTKGNSKSSGYVEAGKKDYRS